MVIVAASTTKSSMICSFNHIILITTVFFFLFFYSLQFISVNYFEETKIFTHNLNFSSEENYSTSFPNSLGLFLLLSLASSVTPSSAWPAFESLIGLVLFQAGLKVGDMILAINTETFIDISYDTVTIYSE